MLIGVACAIGIVVWNVALNATNATALNVDSDILGLSVPDLGSGVRAFVATLLALALDDRGQPMGRLSSARRRSLPWLGLAALWSAEAVALVHLALPAPVALVTINVDRFA